MLMDVDISCCAFVVGDTHGVIFQGIDICKMEFLVFDWTTAGPYINDVLSIFYYMSSAKHFEHSDTW